MINNKLNNLNENYDVIIVGGGAAGFFAAIQCASIAKDKKIAILEQGPKPLSKLKISGGGRCNLTNATFDPKVLALNYPRGHKELIGPFSRFNPKDAIQWFKAHNVELKTESEGRVFPITDSSQTIVDCLTHTALSLGITIKYHSSVTKIQNLSKGFSIHLNNNTIIHAQKLMLATGDSRLGYKIAEQLGHQISDLLPSLFTFKIKEDSLKDLAGTAIEKVKLSIPKLKITETGPLMITHYGLGGPVTLKTSSWGAKQLAKVNYNISCVIDWIPNLHESDIRDIIEKTISNSPKKTASNTLLSIPKKLWLALLSISKIEATKTWNEISLKSRNKLIANLKSYNLTINDKASFKQEFVTCGGVKLSEVDMKTMQSKKIPHLYLGGEILDIDGITGGFNFQAAWTTGFIAGSSMAID